MLGLPAGFQQIKAVTLSVFVFEILIKDYLGQQDVSAAPDIWGVSLHIAVGPVYGPYGLARRNVGAIPMLRAFVP